MEFQLLKALKFDLSYTSPLSFCARFGKAAQLDKRLFHMAQYICDLSMQDYNCLKYIPSEIAASAVVVALHTFDLPHWNRSLQHHSGYFLEDLLRDCVPALLALLRSSFQSNLPSIRGKYSSPNYHSVAQKQPKATLPAMIQV